MPIITGRRDVLALPGMMAVAMAAAAGPAMAAPDAQGAAIDRLMRQAVRSDGPGAALVVVKDGATVFQGAYGLASVEHNVAISADTVFHIASCSKQFVAMAIALLIADQRLRLDDDVRTFVPELPEYGAKIEVQNLLHHTSGIRDQWGVMAVAGWGDGDIVTQDQTVRVICRQKDLNFRPGTAFDYSNSGYTLLAAIVERITGQTLRAFTQARMLGPLGMARSFWHDDVQEVIPNRAMSYTVENGRVRFLPCNLAALGATGMNTTVADLARWDAAFRGGSIFSAEVLAMATTPRPLDGGGANNYCFGLISGSYRDLPTIAHAGADAGFRSHIVRFPTASFSVILLCNNNTIDFAGLPFAIADLMLADQFKQPAPHRPSAADAPADAPDPTPAEAQRFIGNYAGPDGRVVSVIWLDGKLTFTGDIATFAMRPMGEGRFRGAEVPLTLAFTGTGDAARMTELRIRYADNDIRATRLPDIAYTADELNEMAGSYRSPEVDTVLHFAPASGTLALSGLKLNLAAMPVIGRDQFVGPDGMRLQFIRDGAGKTTGLHVSMPHVVNMPLYRMG